MAIFTSGQNHFNRDYADEQTEDADNAAFNVFTLSSGKVHHFWGDEMGPETADPGEDPRGAVDAMSICNILDVTPGGRGKDWYPELEYPASSRSR